MHQLSFSTTNSKFVYVNNETWRRFEHSLIIIFVHVIAIQVKKIIKA